MEYATTGLALLVVLQLAAAAEVYDLYTGKPLTDRRRDYLALTANITGQCTITTERCDPKEGRRVDGTCSNPHSPARGASYTPLPRLLPAMYGPGNSMRPARDGSQLPSTRLIRTSLLADGFIADHPFTQLASHFFVFTIVDNSALDEIFPYAFPNECCAGNSPNLTSPRCIPISVPADDPYTRLTGIRCLNLTRFTSFQQMGCIPNTLPLERFNRVTPLLDLSMVYGNNNERSNITRQNTDGLLVSERQGNRETPPGNAPLCVKNRPPERACYEYGDIVNGNSLIGTNLPSLWFFREHNRLARALAKLNPCWDDDKLFTVARQINIAQYQHIFYYEFIPEIIGRKNALAEGVIFDTHGYVNDFNEHAEPGVILEYLMGSRWFHTFQDAKTSLYSRHGKYQGTRTTVDDEFRSGILELNDTEAQLTQGAFRQQSAKFDDVMDPDLVERLLGDLHAVSDLSAIDMMRGREVGLAPYNDYRKFCGLPVAKKFEDFLDTIDDDKVEVLKRLYDDVDDMEFMVAVYIERLLPGTWVGQTLYCAIVHNLRLWRHSDLHFFEHGGNPTSLTLPQLREIRKTSMSRVLCDSGDGVTDIQQRSFLQLMRQRNELVPCDKIPSIDVTRWRDDSCSKDRPKDHERDEHDHGFWRQDSTG